MLRGRTAAGLCSACVAALLLAAPSVSAGAVRYAAPGGGTAEPCNPTPCGIVKAVNGAADGDQVILTPGTYEPGASIEIGHAVDVGGQAGAAPPLIDLGSKPVFVKDAAAVLHDARIEMSGPAMALALYLEAGTVERVYTRSGFQTGGGCSIHSGLLRDSVCWGPVAGISVGSGSGGVDRATLVNDTSNSIFVIASTTSQVFVNGLNVIAQSSEPGQFDIDFDVGAAASASLVLSHSNYSSVGTSLSAGTNFSYTQPGTNGNQTAEPLFVNAAAGDLHQLPGSPTIDAGVSDPLLGATDLDRNPRSEPPCIGGTPIPDIGAYEALPTAACPKPSNAFKFGKLKRNEKKGTAKLAITVPGAGTLRLSGNGVVPRPAAGTRRPLTAQAIAGAGTLKLLVKAKGKRNRTLDRTGKVKVKVKVTFTPTGGDPNTQARTVKLIKHRSGGK